MDAYIAKKECGCIVMACVDNPEHRRDTAKEVAKAIREGLVIERASADFVREHWFCPTHALEHTAKQVMARMSGIPYETIDREEKREEKRIRKSLALQRKPTKRKAIEGDDMRH